MCLRVWDREDISWDELGADMGEETPQDGASLPDLDLPKCSNIRECAGPKPIYQIVELERLMKVGVRVWCPLIDKAPNYHEVVSGKGELSVLEALLPV